jgi:peptidoglycan hydrolase-like protein with peptidoglycan-binding domain
MPAPDVELCRTIRIGSKGRDIIAVKRALSRAGFMQWGGFTPMWGPHAVRACKAFQKANGLEESGNYGEQTHAALLKAKRKDSETEFAWDAYGAKILHDFCDADDETKVRLAIQQAAFFWNQNRTSIHYLQVRPFPLVVPPELPQNIDCSGFVTAVHHAAGSLNPNFLAGGRMPWNGQGYTGTLLNGGRRTDSIKEMQPGDAVFYGSTKTASAAFPVGAPTHVALYVGDGYVMTHGNEDGPEHVPYNYWSQINTYRIYDVVP